MSNASLVLHGYRFAMRKRIQPEKAASGRLRQFMPQTRHAKARTRRLHRHGGGPFCHFSVPGLPPIPGVYALAIEGEAVYVGKTANLAERWGPRGYGTISPANCFEGGQPTNCRINSGILLAVRAGQSVEVWTNEEDDPEPVETRLLRCVKPRWNVQTP